MILPAVRISKNLIGALAFSMIFLFSIDSSSSFIKANQRQTQELEERIENLQQFNRWVESQAYRRTKLLCYTVVKYYESKLFYIEENSARLYYYNTDKRYREGIHEWIRAHARGLKATWIGDERGSFFNIRSLFTEYLIKTPGFDRALSECATDKVPFEKLRKSVIFKLKYETLETSLASFVIPVGKMLKVISYPFRVLKLGRFLPKLTLSSQWLKRLAWLNYGKYAVLVGGGGAVVWQQLRKDPNMLDQPGQVSIEDVLGTNKEQKEWGKEWKKRISAYLEILKKYDQWIEFSEKHLENPKTAQLLVQLQKSVDMLIVDRGLLIDEIKGMEMLENPSDEEQSLLKLFKSMNSVFNIRQKELVLELSFLKEKQDLEPSELERFQQLKILFQLLESDTSLEEDTILKMDLRQIYSLISRKNLIGLDERKEQILQELIADRLPQLSGD